MVNTLKLSNNYRLIEEEMMYTEGECFYSYYKGLIF